MIDDKNEHLETPITTELSTIEKQAIDLAKQHLQAKSYDQGIKKLEELITNTGCQIEKITSGSNPNIGILHRSRRFPQGHVSIMASDQVSKESQLYNLAHEFLYLQLHLLSMPNLEDKENAQKLRTATLKFAAGLQARIQAELDLAQSLSNEILTELVVSNKTKLLEKIKDPELAYDESRKFLQWH